MHINPYGTDPVLLGVSLANDPPATATALIARCEEHGLIVDAFAEDDYRACLGLIEDWLTVVDAGDPNERAYHLNRLLAKHVSHPRITNHAGDGWHVHYRDDDLTLGGQLATLLLTGTALHLTGRGMNRLGRCASSDCSLVYADVSRNGRQRYCSPRCGSREAVRRHRLGSQND